MARFEYGASDLVEAAVVSGGADALFQLGLLYSAGRDVELDLVVAHKWFNLAALRGNEEAKIYRMEISRELSRQDVARAQRMAREWLRRH
jgi:TPR repeat protein